MTQPSVPDNKYKEVLGNDKDVVTGESKKSLFKLYYRQGMNPHPIEVLFFGEGTLQQIIARAKSFCENTNKRFHLCVPAIIDLDAEEKKHSVT